MNIDLGTYGMSFDVPQRWDFQLLPRESAEEGVESTLPALQFATIAIPQDAGTYGSGLVSDLRGSDGFMVLAELEAKEKATLFTPLESMPSGLTKEAFRPNTLQVTLPGQLGCQLFFSVKQRAFCLYAVAGSAEALEGLLADINAMLGSVKLD